MKIAIGNDHGAVELKQHLVKYLEGKGVEVVNVGTDSEARSSRTWSLPTRSSRPGAASTP